MRQHYCKNAAILQGLLSWFFNEICQFIVFFQVLLWRAACKLYEIFYEMRLVVEFT